MSQAADGLRGTESVTDDYGVTSGIVRREGLEHEQGVRCTSQGRTAVFPLILEGRRPRDEVRREPDFCSQFTDTIA